MKLLNILIISLLTMAAAVAQTPVQMKVDGMSCGFCVNGVKKKLSTAKEVENIDVNLESGLVTFTVKKGIKVDRKKYLDLIEKAGYDPREIKVGDEIKSGKKAYAKQVNYVPASDIITTTFKVAGNCGMCKKKIEGAARSVKGVKFASWDAETNTLTVKYDDKKAALMDIHKKIAAVGYDTDLVRADDNTYNELHSCCQYERLDAGKGE